MGYHQKAVLEYNRVISKFTKWIVDTKKIYENDADLSLELLFNIIPSIHQRAEVSLQLQLGYHSLQTVGDPPCGVDEWIRGLTNGDLTVFKRAASNMLKAKSLLQLKALLQLMELKKAEEFCDQSLKTNIFDSQVFGWDSSTRFLPTCDPDSTQPSFQIKFIEETVTWFLEQARRFLETIKTASSDKKISLTDLLSQIETQLQRLNAIGNAYWGWVKGNQQDELVYFSRWATFLRIGVGLLEGLDGLDDKLSGQVRLQIDSQLKELLQAVIQLYNDRRDKIPIARSKRKDQDIQLELQRFRSDDLPDFVNGLDSFYEAMSGILVGNRHVRFKEPIKKYFRDKKLGDPVTFFKNDYVQLLSALDEYEREFAQNKKISRLLRCNKRLIWSKTRASQAGCSKCLKYGFRLWPLVSNPVDRKSFSGLLRCATIGSNGNYGGLSSHKLRKDDYENIMKLAETHMTHHLRDHSVHEPQKEALHFLGLQRWNSETPAQGRSVGGGYFIYHTDSRGEVDLGIAIDPGFDFVRNLFRMGFSLKDVDIVLISHAHPDHIWDFESMVQLLNEAHSKGVASHRISVILSLGSYQRLQHIISSVQLRQFINPLVIDIRKELEEEFLKPIDFYKSDQRNFSWSPILPGFNRDAREAPFVTIIPTFAYHDDYTEQSDSFGFNVQFKNIKSGIDVGRNFTFGYTGDTKWVSDDLYNAGCPVKSECEQNLPCPEDIAPQYTNCDVILIHLGSLIDHKSKTEEKTMFDYYRKPERCEKLIRDKNHPYLMGIIRLMRNLHERSSGRGKKLILAGEFGEEMRGGIRKDFVGRLRGALARDWPVVPVDVGLDVCLHQHGDADGANKFRFQCALCDTFCDLDGDAIEYVTFGQDEAIFYTCATCIRSTPEDVRLDKLRQIYEIGKQLRMLPQNGDSH